MEPSSQSLFRRNGSRRSCETCRKVKTKCDHALPKCGRCARKNVECFYDPAPMTRVFRPLSVPKTKGQRRPRNSASPGTPDIHRAGSSELITSHGQAVVVSTPPLESAGFLGPTSYHSLMNERASDGDPGVADTDRTTYTIDPRQLDLGLKILDFLANNAVLLTGLVRNVYQIGRAPIIPEVLMLPALDMLWDIFGDYTAQDEASRLRTVVRVFENSYQQIPAGLAGRASELCYWISGKNVKWETIGSVIQMAIMCLIHTPERDATRIDPQQRSKDEVLAQMLEVIDQLLPLSNSLPAVNQLMVCLKYYQMVLASQRFGDSSRWLYSSLGELSSCIYATGIHQYDVPIERYPGFIDLWRRRCFAVVYAMDKTIATILGRPPSITRHYCVLKPPLDIDDDMDIPGYERSLQMLDSNGWNTDGKRRPSTFIRLRFLLATIREEILELHLGVNYVDVEGRTSNILQNLHSIWDSCPSHMKYSPDMWNEPTPCQDTIALLFLYLDYLHSIFLLRRLAAQGCQGEKPKELLLLAKTILSTVLVINEHRERARDVRSDFSSIFLPYGLPSAELLAMELLQSSNSLLSPSYPGLPRAEIIRELTIYISCLSWVARPGSGNLGFCTKVKARLTRILDRILDPSYVAPGSSSNHGGSSSDVSWAFPEHFESDFTINNLLHSDDGSNWDPGFDLFCGPVI
ncbi:hypothetical protein BDV26DRAFT_78120 [Aspergillus bertholletiae]|uniref:Zn(2)-C6 fungal-type domain-containing protein n=1 Tax=Aspergillus bertholletiae TaxID=1226010 RepID=A0A5N7BIE3_9EURO|nr:hypothetical protein BDV26DRAFT_78120 [Aspergillus bertholletiae]